MRYLTAFLISVFLSCSVYAQPEIKAIEEPAPIEKVFKLNPIDLVPETRTYLVQSLEPGFSKKAGGDLFVAKFGADAFRYEYEGEWAEFEPLNHLPILTASAANELYFPDYWTDTNLRFTVRDYGVKVDIILMSDAAPKEFEFRVSKSAKWQDEWIRPVYAYSADETWPPVSIATSESAGVLTYSIKEDISKRLFPVIVDPTFDVAASADDSASRQVDLSSNNPTLAYGWFGHTTTGYHQHLNFYARYILNIPRASKITASNLSVKAYSSNATSGWNAWIYTLQKDNKWEVSGFSTGNYSDGNAIAAIPLSTVYDTWAIGSWTAGVWYDSDDMSDSLQEAIDDYEYDPTHSEDKYVGIRIHLGDAAGGEYKTSSTYDDSAANAPELDATFDPWGSIVVSGGFRLDSDGLKYYGY